MVNCYSEDRYQNAKKVKFHKVFYNLRLTILIVTLNLLGLILPRVDSDVSSTEQIP